MAHTWTWDKLVRNSERLNPKSRGRNYPYTPKFEISNFTSGPNRGQKTIVPFVGTKTCLVSLRAWGVTQASLHNITLSFSDVDIQLENPNNEREYFQIEYNGTMYWIHKFDRLKNPMANRCTCFTGDTKILLADGTYKTFYELEGQEGFDIVSYNEKEDKFEIVKAFNCSKRKDNAQILEVTLDNGEVIKCTPDHRFLLRSGDWVEAKDLSEGDSLRALYAHTTGNDKLKRQMPDGKKQTIQQHNGKEDFYVYVYLDPRYPGEYKYQTCEFDYKPIYVGKGRRNRFMEHWKHPNRGDYFHNTLKHLKSIGMEPIIVKQNINLTEHVAYKLECQLTHEIGLYCMGNGPLLNMKYGGEGGLSGIAEVKVKERMTTNNPMFNPELANQVKQKNIENGSFERKSVSMTIDNPMFREDVKQKHIDTLNEKYTPEQLSEMGKYIASFRTEETWQKISESHKNSERAKISHEAGGKRLADWNRQKVAEGKHHTLTDEWKQITSKTSKKNWENPEIREKMLSKMCALKTAQKELLITNTRKLVLEQIKQNGWFDKTLYVPQENCYNSMLHGHYDIIRDCYQEVYGEDCNIRKIENQYKKLQNPEYVNHKVVSIKYIDNADVYCLTAEYLGNFVVDSGTSPDGVISGVVVENCKDYFFTWAYYNMRAGCLYGPAPKPYVRKTTWMPPRNPMGVPGACKHIYNAWNILRNSGLTMN